MESAFSEQTQQSPAHSEDAPKGEGQAEHSSRTKLFRPPSLLMTGMLNPRAVAPLSVRSDFTSPASTGRSDIPSSGGSVDPLDQLLVSVGPAVKQAARCLTPRQHDKPVRSKSAPIMLGPSAFAGNISPSLIRDYLMKSDRDSDKEDSSEHMVELVASVDSAEGDFETHVRAAAAAPQDETIISPRDMVASVDRSSPRLLSRVAPQRRAYIIRILRKSIPLVATARRDQIRKNAQYSALCILDAFQGRLSNGLANNSKKSKWVYSIFCIQTSEFMLNSVIFASALHSLFVFLEPNDACLNSLLFKLMQWGILLVYAVDIALKMSYEGVEEYFRHDWQQLYVINLGAHVLDLACCGCSLYANPLRPVAGILRARKGRKFFEVLKKMIPGMMHSLVPLVFFVVLIMAFCSVSFDQFMEEFRSTAYTSYNWIFLIFTNDNFGRLLPEAMTVNISYLLFFFPAIYVGQRFLLSLIIGDTYETFRSYVKKQLQKEKLKEIQGLTKAFAALDDRKCGVISDIIFKECMNSLHPNMSEEAIALYFELLSGGQSGINVLQFLSLRRVLAFKMNVSNSHSYFHNAFKSIQGRVSTLYAKIHLPVIELQSTLADRALTFLVEGEYLDSLNLFDIAIFSFAVSDELVLPEYFFPFSLCNVVSFLYICEFSIRLMKHEGHLHKVSNKHNLIAWSFAAGSVGVMVINVITWLAPALMGADQPFLGLLPVGKVLLMLRLMRCSRMANLNEDLKDFAAAIMDIIPALVETFLLTFIVTYMFGALGNLLFGRMEEWGSPLRAIVKAQELTFMVSYLGAMEDAMAAVHPLAIVYFVFYLVISLTVSNIALSIIIDLHGNVLDSNSKKNRDKHSKKLELVFNKIVGQARVRRLFRTADASLNFKNVTISEFQTSDVRHFITDSAGQDIGPEDLKQCQKYASVDLVKFYNEQHQSHKDLNWEVELLKSLQEIGLFEEVAFQTGDVVFNQGKDADQAFVLLQGTVVVSKESKSVSHPLGGLDSESALLHPTNLLGAESLQPGGKYSYTATAEHDTKCLVLRQSDIVHKLEPELSGSVLRMAFKSNAAIESSMLETRRRKRFSARTLHPGQS